MKDTSPHFESTYLFLHPIYSSSFSTIVPTITVHTLDALYPKDNSNVLPSEPRRAGKQGESGGRAGPTDGGSRETSNAHCKL